MLKFKFFGYFVCLIALYFTFSAALSSIHYWKLQGKTKAQNFRFTIQNQSEKYYVKASYNIGVNHIEDTLEETFLNEWAAEQAGLKIQKNPVVFVDPSNLSYSSLQKVFPFKQWAYACVLWALGFYFIFFRQVIGYDSRAQAR